MADYVQYHNPDTRGPLRRPKAGAPYTFSTAKRANVRKGDTLWLITRVLGTSEFHLGQVFTVDTFGANPDGPMKFGGSGMNGTHFVPGIRLNDLAWFPAFKQHMANFSRGLSPLASVYKEHLQALRSAHASSTQGPTPTL